ncbi:MAG TPA: TfpX/TfpZ family type IV pilin accessory protein [Usitatibacter sp.]
MPVRIRVALVHLALSAALALAVFLGIYFYWYPGVFFEGAGGKELFLLIACVNVAIGPLITVVIYKPGKWGLKFDLVCIAVLQLSALAYGISVMFEARPVYIAFVVDRFAIVRANGFPGGALEKGEAKGYGRLSWTGPKFVGVKLPTDADEQFRLATSAAAGVDAEYYPQYYVPYPEQRDVVRAHEQPIEALRKYNPQRLRDIDEAIAATGRKEGEVAFIPMRAGKKDLTVFVDKATGDVLEITSLVPWDQT